MFNVLFEHSATFCLGGLNKDQSKAVHKKYEDMRDILMKTHDFTLLLKYNVDESGITDAFDVFDCLKDLSLNQKQFVYRVLCDYY
jgi:nicotinic acid phosphoribosyltransferase